MTRSKCKLCGGDILWVHTVSGNIIPLDAAPSISEKANMTILADTVYFIDGDFWVKQFCSEPVYTTHAGTCPKRLSKPKETTP